MKKSSLLSTFSIVLLVFFIFLAIGSSDAEVERVEKSTNLPSGEQTNETSEESNSNSRTNPAGMNETFRVRMDNWLVGKVTFEVTMVEVILGDEAWKIIEAGNMFNDAPDEGKEYIMAKFRIKVLETEKDEAFDLSMISFSCISGTGIEYTDFVSVSGVEPRLRNDLYEGAEHEGWVFFMVNVDDDKPVVAMERRMPAETWFDLRGN